MTITSGIASAFHFEVSLARLSWLKSKSCEGTEGTGVTSPMLEEAPAWASNSRGVS